MIGEKMAKKANSKTKNNNNLLIGVFAVLVVLIVAAVIAIIMLNRNTNPNDNESFFVSTDNKYVLTSDIYGENDNGAPVASHDVYYHDGDTITGYQLYYEFADEEAAKAALDYYKEREGDDVDLVELKGKYVVLTANKIQYDGLTMEMLKEWTEEELIIDDEDTEGNEVTETVEVDAAEGDENVEQGMVEQETVAE